ncbi:MAG: DEAD/DEAH box helicase family protein [Candidatus Azobacteroides sp.]|nr:DEAD/DEAH box helicase family protein [Candidatus Azobacteroides sp.]
MTPEEKARLIIDKKLEDAGWQVVDRCDYLPSVSAVAVREGLLKGNLEADYLLFVNGKAIGVIEAKKEDTELSEIVAEQAEKYARKLLNWYPCWQNPLPLVYLSNGKELLFRDIRKAHSEYQPLQQIHAPREMAKIADIQNEFAGLPYLSPRGLRKCQFEAITQLENSFARNEKRALMVLATGAGKTFTACMASYRLLSYTPAKRILFLVDRNNLGKQAEGEFGTFRLTETGDPFNTIFVVERLKSPHIPPESNVVISTIQRIFAVLTGQEFEDDDDWEDDTNSSDNENLVELGNNINLSSDFFDTIIVDECHRSIYGRWQKVLTYFDKAKIIGLTATPVPETLAFFNNNLVVNYTLEKSIADGINVDYRVYRIKTKVSDEGGTVRKGDNYDEFTRYAHSTILMVAEDEVEYGNKELDRSVINPAQIRLVLENFRDAIYSELFPEREPDLQFIPKTLIFAKNDNHATRIVEIVEDVFPNQSPDFVQKITYSAGDSAKLIRNFRNDKSFRIAVTVNLVATGTDIKPLEILVFMRDVASAPLYTQMKGRGVRTIGDEQLRTITPNAMSKDMFYLVDAVGVTESEKFIPKPGEDTPPVNPTLEQLLEKISYGYLPDDYLRLLASRLSRINAKSEEKHRVEFASLTSTTMHDLAMSIFSALESENNLPEFISSNEPNAERKALVALLANNPEARKYLLVLNAGFVKILIPGEDELIYTGFSKEEAASTTQAFEEYVNMHKDEIEALRIIYNNQSLPITYAMLVDLKQKLLSADTRFKQAQLWNFYSIVNKSKVVQLEKNEREVLTNLIQLVRYAFGLITDLRSLPSLAAQRFELWCGQNQRPLTESQKEIMKQIVRYIVANGTYTNEELREENMQIFAQLVKNFGSANVVNEALESLSEWMLAS